MTAELPDAESIRSLLEPGTPFTRVEVVDSTGSTNADLSKRAHSGEAEGAALISMEQRAGRGRLDRQWVSPHGSSISLSVLLKPRPEFQHWGWLSLLAGMAVSSALAELAPDPSRVTLKWPNDVLIGGRKVCGILSERVEQPDGARAVVGLGINVTLTEEQLPVPNATSLSLEGIPTDQSRVVAGVLNHFARYYTAWQLRGSLREEYESRCSSIGSQLKVVVDGQRTVEGTGRGVDVFGRLQVATASGLQTFAVGDVIHARLG
ncbi:biotin--[acetyl-CoA-carboxylase] ligase [Tessaracoccus sp. Y36]|uniref:biotin--[acetyl-CoA-carboxylase] ligase n=1 Tax=Tessaracoccus sp. MC1756 TaxID=2760311 RepID=UPI0015FF4C7E|nr:biotin--[acetyl-CoA-carboxylase] ligase [Tessaracoccus sp. MC1756]